MMSGPAAAAYFEALKGDARNCILITGHTARSALGSRIFDPAFRAQAGLAARAERLTIKVHLDDQDVIALNLSLIHILNWGTGEMFTAQRKPSGWPGDL